MKYKGLDIAGLPDIEKRLADPQTYGQAMLDVQSYLDPKHSLPPSVKTTLLKLVDFNREKLLAAGVLPDFLNTIKNEKTESLNKSPKVMSKEKSCTTWPEPRQGWDKDARLLDDQILPPVNETGSYRAWNNHPVKDIFASNREIIENPDISETERLLAMMEVAKGLTVGTEWIESLAQDILCTRINTLSGWNRFIELVVSSEFYNTLKKEGKKSYLGGLAAGIRQIVRQGKVIGERSYQGTCLGVSDLILPDWQTGELTPDVIVTDHKKQETAMIALRSTLDELESAPLYKTYAYKKRSPHSYTEYWKKNWELMKGASQNYTDRLSTACYQTHAKAFQKEFFDGAGQVEPVNMMSSNKKHWSDLEQGRPWDKGFRPEKLTSLTFLRDATHNHSGWDIQSQSIRNAYHYMKNDIAKASSDPEKQICLLIHATQPMVRFYSDIDDVAAHSSELLSSYIHNPKDMDHLIGHITHSAFYQTLQDYEKRYYSFCLAKVAGAILQPYGFKKGFKEYAGPHIHMSRPLLYAWRHNGEMEKPPAPQVVVSFDKELRYVAGSSRDYPESLESGIESFRKIGEGDRWKKKGKIQREKIPLREFYNRVQALQIA